MRGYWIVRRAYRTRARGRDGGAIDPRGPRPCRPHSGGRSTAAAALRGGRRQGASTRHDGSAISGRHSRRSGLATRHGYAPQLRDSGFHPLDGAVYLRGEGWPAPVCDLVAHHSGSRFVARIRGVDDRLCEFEFIEDASSDALTVTDNTTAPDGKVTMLDERLRDKLKRHRPRRPTPEPTRARRLYSRRCPAAPVAWPPSESETPNWYEPASSPATTHSRRGGLPREHARSNYPASETARRGAH